MERGSRERSEGEAEESTATNRRGIEIIGEHKEQTKQLGEQKWKENSCVVSPNEKNDEYQRIEVVLVPCNYLHTHLGYTGDSIDENCVADLESQIEYLGPLDFMIYFSEQVLMQKEFKDKSIKR